MAQYFTFYFFILFYLGGIRVKNKSIFIQEGLGRVSLGIWRKIGFNKKKREIGIECSSGISYTLCVLKKNLFSQCEIIYQVFLFLILKNGKIQNKIKYRKFNRTIHYSYYMVTDAFIFQKILSLKINYLFQMTNLSLKMLTNLVQVSNIFFNYTKIMLIFKF